MKFTKIDNGIYKSENGYTIKKHVPMNQFTGRPMNTSETRWYIYNSNNEKINWAFTLKEAKEIVEEM
jgi:hypothetical protein